MKVLLTGSTGFIGQKLFCWLEENGFQVNALVRDRRNLKTTDNSSIFEGDILDEEVLRKASNEVDVVFHLVAKTHDLSSIDNTKEYFRINVEGTRNLLNACVDAKIKHFVFFSSVKAMVENSEDTLDETHNPNPTTPYGESKLVAEELVLEYGKKYGFKTTILRLPLV